MGRDRLRRPGLVVVGIRGANVEVRSCDGLPCWAAELTSDESIPPESRAPSGTSLSSWRATACSTSRSAISAADSRVRSVRGSTDQV